MSMCWCRCRSCRGRARPCSAATTRCCPAARAPTRPWRRAAPERQLPWRARSELNLAPAAPVDPAFLAEIDILVANEGEAAALGGNPAELALGLRQALVVTRGAAGSVAYLADGGQIDTPALAIEPIDTTGA